MNGGLFRSVGEFVHWRPPAAPFCCSFSGPAATGSGGVAYVARMRCDWTAEFPAFSVPNGQHTDIAEHRGEPPLDHTGSGMAFLAPGGDKRKLSRAERVARQSETEMRDNQDDGWPKAGATYSCIGL